jgi:EAL domain-containing protein (putative c-di-GMP-specific phosphodiesterase class I)
VNAEREPRTAVDEQVAELLRVAKRSLGLSLTFLSRLDGTTQHLEVVESSIPIFRDGQTQPQHTSFCQAILDGKLPAVIPNVAKLPEAKRLPAARFPRIRSYVSVPVRLSDGHLYGTFCAAGFTADRDLCERDRALMEVLASAAVAVIEPSVQAERRSEEIRSHLLPLIEAGGPNVVLQPIVELTDGRRVGTEALSRFPAAWGKAPDVVFHEATDVGLGLELELCAVERALSHLTDVPGYIAINFSPKTLLHPRTDALMAAVPADRVVIELSEHDPVEDYAALAAALAPHRARGIRLAIDDVGAGFSSLRHIVATAPDIIKLDRSIVAGVGADPVLSSLVRAMVDFAAGLRSKVVAEGIETVEDAVVLRSAGVHLGQGWLFARPCAPAEVLETYPVAGMHSHRSPADASPAASSLAA